MTCESGVAGDHEQEGAGQELSIEAQLSRSYPGAEDLQECGGRVAGRSEPAEFFCGDVDIGGRSPADKVNAVG